MIYFDNAATSFPKPAAVVEEMTRCMRCYCGNPGRSSHKLSLAAAEKIYECRTVLASLFGSTHPENVIFTPNDTYALNIAIKAVARRGDHFLISNAEHNSVIRPLCALGKNGVSYSVFDAFESDPEKLTAKLRAKILPNTRAVICTHASNICPLELPIEKIGALCREKNILFIVDAAQSAGTRNIDIQRMGIDALCAPGHKSLYGPQGSGFVIFSDRFAGRASSLRTFAEGGNGINSLEAYMPDILPERFEAGTLSTPCIAGLCEGAKLIAQKGCGGIFEHETMLYRQLFEMLINTPKITVYAKELPPGSILLFNAEGLSSSRLAERLSDSGICVRSGFHCSPLAHKRLGTGENGAVRVSFGMYNNLSEVECFYAVLSKILCENQ